MTGAFSIAEIPLGSGGGPDPAPPMPPPLYPYAQTVISQYANSPILLQLIDNMAQYIDPTARLNEFFALVWDIDTAQGWGLDVWGRILGVGRILQVPIGEYLGFVQQDEAETFDHGPFYGGGTTTANFPLSDNLYRRLLLAKALANITDGSIPSINQILINLFPGYGNCYVIDNLDMTMVYRFTGILSDTDSTIAVQSGVLPKPAGVSATVVDGP